MDVHWYCSTAEGTGTCTISMSITFILLSCFVCGYGVLNVCFCAAGSPLLDIVMSKKGWKTESDCGGRDMRWHIPQFEREHLEFFEEKGRGEGKERKRLKVLLVNRGHSVVLC